MISCFWSKSCCMPGFLNSDVCRQKETRELGLIMAWERSLCKLVVFSLGHVGTPELLSQGGSTSVYVSFKRI